MIKATEGVYRGGVIHPTHPLDIPEGTHVIVEVRPELPAPARRQRGETDKLSEVQRKAWTRFKRRAARLKLNLTGVRFTRDQLHERS
jgi:predicted DNA-binding antitoxin AbrB/MazE fold protein